MSKLHMICTIVMVLLLGSTATFGISFFDYYRDDGGNPDTLEDWDDERIDVLSAGTYDWEVDLDVAVSAEISAGTGYAEAYAEAEVKGPIDDELLAFSAIVSVNPGTASSGDTYHDEGTDIEMDTTDYLHLFVEYEVTAAHNPGAGYSEAVAFTSATGDIW